MESSEHETKSAVEHSDPMEVKEPAIDLSIPDLNEKAAVDGLGELAQGEAQGEQFGQGSFELQALDSSGADETVAADTAEDLVFLDDDRMMSIIESVLFASDRPVSLSTLKTVFEGTTVKSKDITRALERLASSYAGPSRGVSLDEVTGGYQLRTKVDNAEFLKRNQKVRPFRLSGPALEVISIIAYKQPITKPEIDHIRGVESGHLVRALMERGLVHFGEKSDLPGRPMQYLTTRKFLEIFGLRNLDELPSLAEIDQLLPEGIGEDEEKETLSDLTEQLSQQVTGQYSAAEDELIDISESLKVIDSTSEFFEQEKRRQKEQRDRDRAQDLRERLTVGEMVEEKDIKWLERYEKALAQAEAEAFSREAAALQDQIESRVSSEDSAEVEAVSVVEELEALTAELAEDPSLDRQGDNASDAEFVAGSNRDEDLNSDLSVEDEVEFEAEGNL